MANILLAYGNKCPDATLSGGTWDSPSLDNLKTTKLAQVARSSSASLYSTQFRADLTANYAVRALALVNHTLTSGARWRARGTTATLDMDFVTGMHMAPATLTTSGGANGTRVGIYGLIEAATCPRYDFSPVNLASGTASQTLSNVPPGTYVMITSGGGSAVMATGTTVANSGAIATSDNANFVVVTATGDVTLTVLSAATQIHFRESLGLLAEEARTNELLTSLCPGGGSGSNWQDNGTGGSWASNAAVAPDGSTTATRANVAGTKYTAIDAVAGESYIVGQFVKSDGSATAQLICDSAGISPAAAVTYTFATQSFSSPTASVADTGYLSYRDGWVFVWMRIVATATAGIAVHAVNPGTGDLFIWDTDVQKGMFPTSHIRTTSAAVTRSADSVSFTGSNFSGFYSGSAGTLYMEGHYNVAASVVPNNRVMLAFYGAGAEVATVYNGSGFAGSIYVADASSAQQFYAPGTISDDSVAKVAYAFNGGDYARCGNAAAVQTGSGSAVMSTMNRMFIGAGEGGGSVCGHIRRISFWQARLTNDQLQGTTTTGPEAAGLDTGWMPAKQLTFHGEEPANWGTQYPLIAAFDAVTVRRLLIEFDDVSNPDGHIDLGHLFIGNGFQPTTNAEYQGFADNRVDPSNVITGRTGRVFGTPLPQRRQVDFHFPSINQDEADHLDEMRAEVGILGQVLYVPDPDDAAHTQRYGFLGRFRELSALEYPFFEMRATPMRLEESK